MPALRELLATFQIEVEEGALKQAEEHIEGFKTVLKQAGEVVAEAFAVEKLKEFIESEIQAGAQLKITSERLGIAVDELQALELAAGQAGLSTESLTRGLRFLNRNVSEAREKGGESAKAFQKLGIHIRDLKDKTPADVLELVANGFSKLTNAGDRTRVAMQLFGKQGGALIPLLKEGGAGIEAARKQLEELGGGMSEEFVESAHAAEAANVRLEFAMKGLKSQIATALFPAFAQLVQWFTHLTADLVRFNKETNVLTTGMTFLGTIAAFKAISGLRELLPLIQKLTTSLILADVSLFGLEIPLLVVIGALGLLYLAFDDVYTLMTGGESVIGDTFDEFLPGLGGSVQLAKDLKEAFSAFLDVLGNVGSIIFNTLVYPFEEALAAAKGVGEALGDIAGGHFAQALADLKKAGDAMAAVNDKRGGKILAGFEDLGDDFTLSKEGRRKKREAAAIAAGETLPGYEPGGKNFVGPVLPPAAPVPLNIYGHPLPPMHVPEGIHTHAASRDQLRGSGEGVTIHQTNNTKVDVHHTGGEVKPVADAVGQGVSTGLQRANDRARVAMKKP